MEENILSVWKYFIFGCSNIFFLPQGWSSPHTPSTHVLQVLIKGVMGTLMCFIAIQSYCDCQEVLFIGEHLLYQH